MLLELIASPSSPNGEHNPLPAAHPPPPPIPPLQHSYLLMCATHDITVAVKKLLKFQQC